MLSYKEANEILFDSELDEGDVIRDKRIAAAPKQLRTEIIQSNPESIEAHVSAAVEIQRVWRGYRGRCNVYHALNPKVSKTAVFSESKDIIQRVDDFEEVYEKSAARLRLEHYYHNYVYQMQEAGALSSEIILFEDYCAHIIQNWWNAKKKEKKPVPLEPDPPPLPKPIPPPPKKKREGPISPKEAAIMIQRAWRRHIDIQVYRYYRDLINFKTRGNPSMMLRCINPKEAKILDPACGVHVRFRLAGERFPPNIYYKIFTHRPIQDMCANSPKDYTIPQSKQKTCKDAHSRNRKVQDRDDGIGWYRRMDNNGWRLVSDRLIHHIMSDSITWESSQKKYEFHHNKIQRKQDIERRKKKRKVTWMKKMYKEGMLKARADDDETVKLIEGAAAGMVATVDMMGPEALEDWEVDELLDWTTSLNFDDYLSGWKELATSAHSEKVVDKIRVFASAVDPFEFSVSTGPSRYQSRQSHNTPVSSVSAR
ncbi:hypothetical protein ScPMuIL_013322 [Solemya velum]